MYRVGAFAGFLRHRVTEAVDHIGVIAFTTGHHIGTSSAVEQVVPGTTDQRVGAFAAMERVVTALAVKDVVTSGTVQGIVAAVAGDDVVQIVAGTAGVRLAQQGEVLDVIAQRGRCAGLDGIDAAVRLFDHRVAGIVHHIGVVACAAHQRVGTAAAVEPVVAVVAIQGVVAPAPGEDVVRLGSFQGVVAR